VKPDLRIQRKETTMAIPKVVLLVSMLAAGASLDCAAANAYRVEATLRHAGESFATPAAVVEAGKPATIEVAGDKGYKLSFDVEELAEGKLKFSAALASPYGSMSPELVVVPGQPAAVAVGDLGLSVTVSPRAD
jgi:hypothetical protein